MDKQYFIELLEKYQRGDLTPEEKRFLEAYYDLFQNEPDILQTFSAAGKKEFKDKMLKGIWDDIIVNEKQPDTIVSMKSKRFWRIAVAAAIVTGVLGSVVYIFNLPSKKTKAVAVIKNQPLLNKDNDAAVKLPDHLKENRIIFLPDGSKVMLSAGSKLNYPSSFDGMDKREVFLDGEAFFDVRHNPAKTFVVHTGNLATAVLGTAFNIKAINGEKDIVVTVKRGKVRVSDKNKVLGVITPNQQITYDKKKIISVVTTVSNENYLNWQDKDLFIDNLTISEAAKLMEERYNVQIFISDPEVKSLRFTTTFPKNEKLEQTLNSICLFNGLTYSYDREKAIVAISRK